jgi:hypothetical protein
MKRFVFAALALSLGLVACTSPEDQANDIARVQASLPASCKLNFAGYVNTVGDGGDPSRIFYVVCGDIVTTSTTYDVSHGKTSSVYTDVTVIKQ